MLLRAQWHRMIGICETQPKLVQKWQNDGEVHIFFQYLNPFPTPLPHMRPWLTEGPLQQSIFHNSFLYALRMG